jgi:hypothetical protein
MKQTLTLLPLFLSNQFNIVTILGCDYRRGVDWILDLLTTFIHLSELHFTDHWHTRTSVLRLLQFPLVVFWQRLLPREIFQFPALRSVFTAARAELLSTDNSTNMVAGLRPLRTNLIVFSSQRDFQLTTDNFNSGTRLTLLISFRHEPHREHRFHCYSVTIPRPLHAYSLPREPFYRAVA